MVKIKHQKLQENNPMLTVLIQELQRYNVLLGIIDSSISQLQKGIAGESVITDSLEKMNKDLDNNKVPEMWSGSYFSLKSLSSWYIDLQKRYEFFTEWATKNFPIVYTIGYFTYPIGFTTSLLQGFSRKPGGPAIDLLSFDF
jgi:dynein heavy chain, axonemal